MNESGANTTGTIPPTGPEMMLQVTEPLGLRVVRLALYVIIFVIATFGNSLVIFVVYKTRELHTVTGYLIANLAIADLGVGLLCIPFTVVYFELNFYWPFGSALCKIIPSLMPLFLMGSVGTMLAISLDRHQSIVYPFGARITRHQSKLLMLLIWLIALLPALPLLPVMRIGFIPDTDIVACLEYWPPLKGSTFNFSQLYTICTFLLTYLIPLPIMSYLYIRIGLKLQQASKEGADRPGFTQARKTQRIIKMLAAVVACYAFCFLPFHTLYFMIEYGKFSSRYQGLLQSYFQVLMYFNSATNPLLYAFMGDQFKTGFMRAIGRRKNLRRNITISTRGTTVSSF